MTPNLKWTLAERLEIEKAERAFAKALAQLSKAVAGGAYEQHGHDVNRARKMAFDARKLCRSALDHGGLR